MEQLRMLDAGFLIAEDSDRHISLATGAIAIIEGGAPDHVQFKSILAERIRKIPRCRQLPRNQPFNLGPPNWVDDPGFHLNHHVRRLTLRRPGDDPELLRAVADVLQRRLQRDRPLWECWLIEGLEGNRWAILLKIHCCIADGVMATRILSRLCEQADGDTSGSTVRPRRAAAVRAHLRPVPDLPRQFPADDVWRVAATITRSAARTVRGAADVAAGLIRPATGPRSTGWSYRAVRVPLVDVEQVCRKFDVTIDDVARAAITAGLRSVSLHRGEPPNPRSLPTALPIEEPDPVQQLRTVHVRLRRADQGDHRSAGSTVVPPADHLPFMLSVRLIRLMTQLPRRSIVTLAPNVSGPMRPLKLLNRKVVEVLPVPPLELRLRTGVGVLSYGDDLVFGITTDADAAADVEQLASGITRAVGRLVALSGDSVLLFAR